MIPGTGLGSPHAHAVPSDAAPCSMSGAGPVHSGSLSSASRFVQRLRRRYAAELPLLPPGDPTPPGMLAAYASLRERGDDAGTALRILRQLVLERLITLDCDQQAPLGDVTRAMTELAE